MLEAGTLRSEQDWKYHETEATPDQCCCFWRGLSMGLLLVRCRIASLTICESEVIDSENEFRAEGESLFLVHHAQPALPTNDATCSVRRRPTMCNSEA